MGWEESEATANGSGISLWDDENVLELVEQLCESLKAETGEVGGIWITSRHNFYACVSVRSCASPLEMGLHPNKPILS